MKNDEKIILQINHLKKNYHDDKSEITAIEDINLELYEYVKNGLINKNTKIKVK